MGVLPLIQLETWLGSKNISDYINYHPSHQYFQMWGPKTNFRCATDCPQLLLIIYTEVAYKHHILLLVYLGRGLIFIDANDQKRLWLSNLILLYNAGHRA